MALRLKDRPKYEKKLYKVRESKVFTVILVLKIPPLHMIYDQTSSNCQFYCNEDQLKCHQSADQECYFR